MSESNESVRKALKQMAEKVDEKTEFPVVEITVKNDGRATIKGEETVMDEKRVGQKNRYKKEIMWR